MVPRHRGPPASFASCAGAPGPDGFPSLTETMQDVEIDDTSVYVVVTSCSGLLRVRRSDLCAATVPIQGLPVTLAGGGYRGIDVFEGQILMGGAQGALVMVEP